MTDNDARTEQSSNEEEIDREDLQTLKKEKEITIEDLNTIKRERKDRKDSQVKHRTSSLVMTGRKKKQN